jgi:hypothetical protein
MNHKLTLHAQHERCQQRAVPAFVFELMPFAESARAPHHAETLYFTRKSFQRMREAGVCPKQIKVLQQKRNLRLKVDGGTVITVMYAYECKKRIRQP